jgi:hypothetical protein
MRARHRHFKHGAAGAEVALDTRYIHSVADNTNVQTWDDKSGNGHNATQATASSRATYKATIQGGNGILRFDGSNDWYIIDFEIFINSFSVFAVFQTSGTNQRLIDQRGTGAAGAVKGWFIKPKQGNDNDGVFVDDSAGGWRGVSDSVSTSWHVASGHYSNLSVNYYVDGVLKNTRSVSGGATVGNIETTKRIHIGANVNGQSTQIYNGDVGMLVVYKQEHAAPLRRRIENHAAYSFKIAYN